MCIILLFYFSDVALQYLTMSNDELWLVKEFTEDMERRFEVRNFTPNSSTVVYEQAALHYHGIEVV